jgi:hypothetical protein
MSLLASGGMEKVWANYIGAILLFYLSYGEEEAL